MFGHIISPNLVLESVCGVSKRLERFVACHFNKYLQLSALLSSLQSNFQPNNSTEKAVLHVLSDLLEAVHSEVIAVCLLPLTLSNAVHSILCRRLELSWTSFSGHISMVVHSTSVVECIDHHLSSSSAGFRNAQSLAQSYSSCILLISHH